MKSLRRLLTLGFFWLLSITFAQNLVVYPLNSQDFFLGVAVADRISQAFEASLEVIPPEVAPGLAPPLVAENGFFSLLRISEATDTRGGVTVLRDILGADYVLTGTIDFMGDSLDATFYLAGTEGTTSFRLSAPQNDPTQLAQRATAVLANQLGVAAATAGEIDLSTPYGDYVQAVGLLGAGQIEDAFLTLDDSQTDEAVTLEPRLKSLYEAVRALRRGEPSDNLALQATGSLSLEPVDEAVSIAYFEAFDAATSLPVTKLWLATLQASADNDEAARAAFDAADYPYALAAFTSYLSVNDPEAANVTALLESESVASLLAASLIAQVEGDLETEKAALQRVTTLAPSYTYPFERLSFIAFDEEDPLAAAQALAVAVQLDPESDLYWTNLGWSYYLLGILDQSEEASRRAVELDPGQYIALYNLGLAQVATGRLDDALAAYDQAIAIDPEVDDAAVEDLENALELYPNQPAIHYPLATLYEQEGRRAEAAQQFQLYLAANPVAPYDRLAAQRFEVLTAPPPAIEISSGASVGLGASQLDSSPFRPGDRVYASFELYTPGAELPKSAEATLELKNSAGEVVLDQTREVSIPQNAIGYVVKDLGLTLPRDLAAGSYQLGIMVNASNERSASSTLDIEVAGSPALLRQLLSRNIVLVELATDSPFYSVTDLQRPDEVLVTQLLSELETVSEAAAEALPEITEGRFAGKNGGEAFLESTGEDVQAFLSYLLSGEAADAEFPFVDAYAQWLVDGTPEE